MIFFLSAESKMKSKKIILVLISTVISFVFIELSLRLFGFNKLTIYYSSNYYGYYHEPNQQFLSRFNKSLSLDNLGNRNSKDFNINNSNLFFLGDSVTYGGSVVSNEETFSYLISEKFEKKYLNIASNGWGIPNIINFIDFHNLYKGNSTYVLTCILDCFTRNLRKSEQNLFFKKKDSLALISFYKLIIFKLNEKNYSSNKNGVEGNINFIRKDNDETIRSSVEKLSEFNQKLNKINSKLIFVYSPNLNYLKSLLRKDNNYDFSGRKDLLNYIENKGIKVIDIQKYFDQKTLNNFRRFYSDNVHLSNKGHYLYFEILSDLIYD